MTAITITAANVALVSGEPLKDQIAGGAFTAGQSVYRAANGSWLKAQDDGTAIEAGSNNVGVALGTADASGARVSIASTGCVVSYGAGVLAAGVVYALGDAAGAICPIADAASTDKVTILGLAISTASLKIQRVYDAGAVVA
jgi:hypothetical protein